NGPAARRGRWLHASEWKRSPTARIAAGKPRCRSDPPRGDRSSARSASSPASTWALEACNSDGFCLVFTRLSARAIGSPDRASRFWLVEKMVCAKLTGTHSSGAFSMEIDERTIGDVVVLDIK